METIRIDPDRFAEAAESAAAALRTGGVALIPTDTLYGLAANAFSDDAVDTVYRIKGRKEDKPVHALVGGVEMARTYGEVNEFAERLLRLLPPGKVTYIVQKLPHVQSGICSGINTFGFRIPDSALCARLIEEFGGPVTATSGNRSGMQPPRTATGILEQLGEGAELIDVVLDAGELPPSKPSTVIDLTGKEPAILREGAVPAALVWEAIRSEY